MNYLIRYSCCSHIGKCRRMNQDNFICDGKYMNSSEKIFEFPLEGKFESINSSLVGVFDGLGGEEHGEIASLIAAQCAYELSIGDSPIDNLLEFCRNTNERICKYAIEHDYLSMGTTAAILVFSKKKISLCNIGDTKIFRFAGDTIEQISKDHYVVAVNGRKSYLSQNLGIPDTERIIEPYIAKGIYHDKDVYLLCSDGLTDMVSVEEISKIIKETEFCKCAEKLRDVALYNGGKDNITIILCKIEKKKANLFGLMKSVYITK